MLVCLGFGALSAQEVYNSTGKPGYHKKTSSHKGYDPSKLIIGGGFTAEFGGGYAIAGIAPMVGYRFARHFEAGIGVGYLYSQQPDPISQFTYNTYYDFENIISPNIWARYFVWRSIYVTSTFEYNFISLSLPDVYYDANGNPYIQQDKSNVAVPSLLLGAGYKMPIAGRVSAFGELLFDVLNQPNNPYYGQPVIRFGIAAGL